MTPQFFFAFLIQVAHDLTAVKIFKKIYRPQNFRANALKVSQNFAVFKVSSHHQEARKQRERNAPLVLADVTGEGRLRNDPKDSLRGRLAFAN